MTSPRGVSATLSCALAVAALATAAAQQKSAPIGNLRYDVTFDSATARSRIIKVVASFDVKGDGPVLLSFPAWTPGAYELGFFARWVLNFAATAGNQPVVWDKLDYDTWRVQPRGARSVTVRFDYLADTLDNAMAWARPDFVLSTAPTCCPTLRAPGTTFRPRSRSRPSPAGRWSRR